MSIGVIVEVEFIIFNLSVGVVVGMDEFVQLLFKTLFLKLLIILLLLFLVLLLIETVRLLLFADCFWVVNVFVLLMLLGLSFAELLSIILLNRRPIQPHPITIEHFIEISLVYIIQQLRLNLIILALSGNFINLIL